MQGALRPPFFCLMRLQDSLNRLKEFDKELCILRDALAVLEFDQETAMPEENVDERSRQQAALSAVIQKKATDRALRSVVDSIDEQELSSAADRALVRRHKRFLRTEGCLDEGFVAEEKKLTCVASAFWQKARAENDFSLFAPYLEKIISHLRTKAGLIDSSADCYDTLLSLYEEDSDADKISAVFDELEPFIHDLIVKTGGKSADTSFLCVPYDKQKLHSYCLDLIGKMGFDFKRGAVSLSAHPFTSFLGTDDIRITTRYSDPGWFDPVATIVHECGHALYDMNAALNPEIRGTSLGYGSSMSLHESMSRFWENMILRSRAFWLGQYPEICKVIPGMQSVPLDSFLKAVSKAEPSAIRVNADELTYPMHIILRFRLEKALIGGQLSVNELPSKWNELSEQLIGYEVRNDSEGCLQDSHWAGGLFGYFPSYAMGSIAAASFYAALEESAGGPDVLEAEIAAGNFGLISSFLNDRIWRFGSVYTFEETVRRVTGRQLDISGYKVYLERKYSSLYNL